MTDGDRVDPDPLVPIDPRIVASAGRVDAIGAPTTNASDLWSWPRRPALALAQAVGARLILADVSTRSLWTTPYGSGGVGADRLPPYSDGMSAVSRDELALLGRDYLIEQLNEAEALNVDAAVWLADQPGILALDRFLSLFPVDVLVVPPLNDPSLVDKLRGDDIAAVRRRMEGRLLLVAQDDGTLQVDPG